MQKPTLNSRAKDLTRQPKGITDLELLRLVAKGLNNKQIAVILGCSQMNVHDRLARLIPGKKTDDVLINLSKGKALDILSAIDAGKIAKAGLGEMSNAAKRLAEINHVVSGKSDNDRTININLSFDTSRYSLSRPIDVEGDSCG